MWGGCLRSLSEELQGSGRWAANTCPVRCPGELIHGTLPNLSRQSWLKDFFKTFIQFDFEFILFSAFQTFFFHFDIIPSQIINKLKLDSVLSRLGFKLGTRTIELGSWHLQLLHLRSNHILLNLTVRPLYQGYNL